ncbi:MAG TPA: TonB-dependent receptor [Ignavibacteriaceae bacterium]|nr:TonB-dependent receptor [Ignavibacteriaceae bacterium]
MKKYYTLLQISLYLALIFNTTPSYGQYPENNNADQLVEADIDTLIKTYEFPVLDIIGNKPSLINRIPGSATIISNSSLKNIQPFSGNEMFREVSSLNVVDEEGIGLRANIGIRGLDPDRSRTVLMMEDGVPIALAPYGEPEMYYTPAIDRMESIEILKGSGSILFGPQTIGGVINYVTNDPPLNSKLTLIFKGAENGFISGQAGYGTTIDNTGFYVGILHKQADKIGVTNFGVNDITAKIKFQSSKNSYLGLKFSLYDEISNSTYIGLTQTMYDNEEYFTVIAPNDHLDIRRYSASLTHDYFFSENTFLRTTVYGYTTTRDWLRQDFSRSPVSNGTGIVFGDTTVSGGAIYMRNTTGNRNRQFEVAGIEPRIHFNYNIGDFRNELEGGFRLHYERAFEQRIDGETADAQSGNLREDEIRTGYAGSIFAQNRIFINNNLTVIPGLRFEKFNYKRDIFRIDYKDTSITNNDEVFATIPGLGVNYNLNNTYSFFAGVHRGYAPPRIKDAITNGGKALQLDAELSWNYELGLRVNLSSFFYFEMAGFLLDFSNQIIPVSESSGGSGTGLVNGGETLHHGIEGSVRFDFQQIMNSENQFSFVASATYSNATYSNDRFITVDNESVNIEDNELPYAPEFTFSGRLQFTVCSGFGLQIAANYVDEQFTDQLNTEEPSADGQSGLMPSFIVTDVTGSYQISQLNATIFVSVKNLLDERYIASKRPQGIKVGVPRMITAGIDLAF